MTFQRDLAWQRIELIQRSSIAHHLARYALTLNFDLLPEKVVHAAKRCLLDTLGCAIGAWEAPGRPMCEAVIEQLGGREEATVFGSGYRTNILNAMLMNSFLVRFLDYNDLGGGGHNSDAISGLLAISEREKSNGRDFITAMVISYEIGARFRESVIGRSLGDRGWTVDVRGGLNMPPAVGKLMGLNQDQIANAIGICASHSIPLEVLDSNWEENTNAKNLRYGFVAYHAILSCMLAQQGFTGPVRVVEGDKGIQEVLLNGDLDLNRLVNFSGWRILDTGLKYVCANATSHGQIYATLAIVKEHDLKPEDIEAVRIIVGPREARHTTCLPKKYPRNAETADHSSYYANAIAIKDRSFGPDSIEPEKFTDPVVLDLIERITVEADPNFPVHGKQGISEITTRDGRQFRHHVETPHGFDDDPLSDDEVEEKFREMAEKYMDKKQIRKIFDMVWNIESLDNMGQLMPLMVFAGSPRKSA
jgi:2-methylcitrate dehydratase